MEPLRIYFKNIKIDNILDIGTGKGGFINVLKNTFPGSKITGIDPDINSLKTAKLNYPEINFQKMEAENLLFNNNSFDVVCSSMALHHFPKVKKALKEIKRVVKPGGYILINETISSNLSPAQEVHKLYHHFRSKIDRMTGKFHRKTFTKDAILQLLKEAEIPIQFFFEHKNNINIIKNESDLILKIDKMTNMLETIKGKPEYFILLPQIDLFKKNALRYGFQRATTLVIVGRKKLLIKKTKHIKI